MNIAVVTENNSDGKVPRDFGNLRTEFGWIYMLDAIHISYKTFLATKNDGTMNQFDLILFIIPKKHPQMIAIIRNFDGCMKGIIQEGPFEYFQEWPVVYQQDYLNILEEVDLVFVHNEIDVRKLRGICTPKEVHVIPTCHFVKDYKCKPDFKAKSNSIMVNGTCCSWYNGMVSLGIAKQVGFDYIAMPGMGRQHQDQSAVSKTLNLNYMQHKEWMVELSNYRYSINMMDEIAAGSFNLNCAMVGIPCVGFSDSDTQRRLFPELSVKIGEYSQARDRLQKLKNDDTFYAKCIKNLPRRLKQFDIEVQGPKLLSMLQDKLILRKI